MTTYKLSLSDAQADKLAEYLSGDVAEQIRAQIPKPVSEEPEPVWWTTDPAAAHAAAKVGVVYGGTSEQLSWQIGEQLRPAVDEPQEFASVVRATSHGEPMLWQKTPMHGKHYWESETGVVDVWSDLTDVEVLRVGLGAAPLAEWESELLSQQERRDIEADAYRVGERFGATSMNGKIHIRLQRLLAESITSERKNALEKAIQAVEELAL